LQQLNIKRTLKTAEFVVQVGIIVNNAF